MVRDLSRLKRTVLIRFILGIVVVGLILFIPAGSLFYWEAWIYLGVIFLPMLFILHYLLKEDPGLLERRMRTREREAEQRTIIALTTFIFFIGFIVPGLDYRFGWSDVPPAVVLGANAVVFLGYMIFFWTIRENSYASRVIEVEEGQKVISSGPYAIVRHPMYLGMTLMILGTPLALGSYWAIPVFLPMLPFLVLRIYKEEEVLVQDLPGYAEYRQKTRYRLIPFIW